MAHTDRRDKMKADEPAIMVFTDLDGTLLDHDTYRFEAARPALALLAARGIEVVPVTSKTIAELDPLMQQLGLRGGAICENGAVLRNAENHLDCSVGIVQILNVLDELPQVLRRDIFAFCDMSVAELAQLTGLDETMARFAANRQASMPFLWRGVGTTPPGELIDALRARNLALTQGGRFFHIVPFRDKAGAMREMLDHLPVRPQSWALGDGPNDVSMLLAADYGALVANPHLQTQALLPDMHSLYLTREAGPHGWREAIEVFLAREFS